MNSKVLKASVGYTIGNILIKAISFLVLPIFSRIMTVEEFGLYNLFLSYDSFFFIISGLALHTSVRSAKYEFDDSIDSYTSSITLIYLLNLGVLLLLVVLFNVAFTSWTGLSRFMQYMLVVYSFSTALITLYNERLSLDYSFKKYLLVAGINSVGSVAVSLALMLTLFSSDKVSGRIAGASTVVLALALGILIVLYRKAKPVFNKKFWKFGIIYSLPIIPHGLSQVILSQFDRIMINRIVDTSSTGIYSLAGNLKIILSVISDSISTAWTTWFYEKMKENQVAQIRRRAAQLVAFFVFLTVGLMTIAPELILFLGGENYSSSVYSAIPLIAVAYILFLYNIVVPGEYYTKKTKFIMIGTVSASVINIILNYFFISEFGYIAAAYTTLFSYLCYLIFHLIIVKKLLHFSVIPMARMLLCSLAVVFFAGIAIVFAGKILLRYLIGGIFLVVLGIFLARIYFAEKKSAVSEEGEK